MIKINTFVLLMTFAVSAYATKIPPKVYIEKGAFGLNTHKLDLDIFEKEITFSHVDRLTVSLPLHSAYIAQLICLV